MKRQATLLLLFIVFLGTLQAQTDIKVNPLQMLWGDVHVGAEFGLKSNFSLEPRLIVDNSTLFFSDILDRQRTVLMLEGKLYTRPDQGMDGFYLGAYTRGRTGDFEIDDMRIIRNRLSVGFLTGYKWLSANNIFAELGLGVGRALYDNIEEESLEAGVPIDQIPLLNTDFMLKVALGYRF